MSIIKELDLKFLTRTLEYFGIKNRSIEKMEGNIRQLIE